MSLSVNCSAHGFPKPSFSWQRTDDKPILMNGAHYGELIFGNYLSKVLLTIQTFQCLAMVKKFLRSVPSWENTLENTNVRSTMACWSLYIVKSTSKSPVSFFHRKINHLFTKNYFSGKSLPIVRPEIVVPNALVKATNGSDAIFDCIVEAFPQFTYEWQFRGRLLNNETQGPSSYFGAGAAGPPIDPSTRKYTLYSISFGAYQTNLRLVVHRLDPHDYGVYQLRVRNLINVTTASMELVRKYKNLNKWDLMPKSRRLPTQMCTGSIKSSTSLRGDLSEFVTFRPATVNCVAIVPRMSPALLVDRKNVKDIITSRYTRCLTIRTINKCPCNEVKVDFWIFFVS